MSTSKDSDTNVVIELETLDPVRPLDGDEERLIGKSSQDDFDVLQLKPERLTGINRLKGLFSNVSGFFFRHRYYALAIAAHSLWGLHSGLTRYLQVIAGIPSMQFLGVTNFLLCVILFVWSLWTYFRSVPREVFMVKTITNLFRERKLALLIPVIAIARSVTNTLGPRFTLSIYIQLITMLVPFIIAGLNVTVLKQALPRGTIPAALLCLAGAVLIIMGKDFLAGNLRLSLEWWDWVGISLAFVSSVFLSIQMLMIKEFAASLTGVSQVFLSQGSTALCGFIVSPILRESWVIWTQLSWQHWVVFFVYVLIILLGGNMLQVAAIRAIGPATVSSLLALRLITAMIYGALALGEDMTNPLQLAGAAVVIVTISVYLWRLRVNAPSTPKETLSPPPEPVRLETITASTPSSSPD